MVPIGLLWLGFLASLGCVLVGIVGVTYLMPTKIMVLKTDPPPNAHYIRYPANSVDGQEIDPKDKAAIALQKELEVFYHALHYCGGRCANRELKAVIDREWNTAYQHWPQYRKYWYIGEPVIRETLKKWDWSESGLVIQLEGDYAGAFVLMDMGKNAGRRLIRVSDLVAKFVEKPPEKLPEPEAVEEDDNDYDGFFGVGKDEVKRVDEVDDAFFSVENLPLAAD